MKTKPILTLLTVAMVHLFAGNAHSAPVAAASQTNAPSSLSPGANEVAKLAQSGVSDDVVLSFIEQSPSYYSLAAADIVELKAAGVSSQALSAMLNHDTALRTKPASAPAAASPSPPQTASAPSDAAAPTAIANPTSDTTAVVAPPPAPAPQVEIIPVTPGPDYVWTPGWWSWNGGAWIWFGGYWGHPSRPGHIWINGNFYHGRAYRPARGHWR